LIQIKPVYNYNLNKYNKILFQRNNILKSNKFKDNLEDLLESFDNQLVKIGTSIIINRMEYIKLLDKEARDIHKVISSGKEILKLKYDTNVKVSENKEEIEYNYMNALKENLSKDIDYRTTQIGPHRDDMIININDNSARVFGSQGQQRSTVLSLKLAEVEIIKKQRGSYPVLLLDDVYSELDMDRRKYLTELFNNMQTFITVSNSESLDSIKYANKTIYNIEDGKIINRR
ncbi:MAG TPA: DNA replication and repair protein RecF, partial [Tissierellaceae bacterium]